MGNVVQLDHHIHRFAGDQGLRPVMPLVMGKVHEAERDPCRGTVGRDVVKPDRHQRQSLVGGHAQVKAGGTEDFDCLGQAGCHPDQ